jgi:hypothetical protein
MLKPIRERFSTVAPLLDERGGRLVAAAEAFAVGYGGIAAVAAEFRRARRFGSAMPTVETRWRTTCAPGSAKFLWDRAQMRMG